MITDITKADTANDVSQYAGYLFNPKPGHKDYIAGERVLATSSDMLLGDHKEQVKHLLLWNQERRPGKAPPKSQALVGSIAFHPDDKLTPEEAIEVARKAVHKVMGDDRPVIYVAHGDTAHLHVHIIAATVNSKGTIYAKRFDFRDWEHANEELEIEHNLTRVKQRKSEANRDSEREVLVSAPSNEAMQLAEKGILTPKEELRGYVDAAYATGDFNQFLATLDAYGVRVKPNVASTGTVSGMSFALASDKPGQYIKASDFGKAFAWKKLSETLHYDKDQHAGRVAELKRTADAYDAGIDRNSPEVRDLLGTHDTHAIANERPATATVGAGAPGTTRPDREIEGRSGADRSAPGRGLGDVGAGSEGHHAPAPRPNQRPASPSIRVMDSSREIVEPVARAAAQGRELDESGGGRPSATSGPKESPRGNVDRLDDWGTADRIRAMADAVKGGITDAGSNAKNRPNGPNDERPVHMGEVRGRAVQSFDRARASIERQVKALGRAFKDMVIGIRNAKGVKEERRDALTDDYLTHLRADNAQGKHIQIKPALDEQQRSDLILLDDITLKNIQRMEKDGIPAACVIESSPGNYQAWVRFPAPLYPEYRTNLSRHLSRTYECDTGAIGNDRWGRLAGFTNTKPERQLANGKAPFVQVHSSSGRIIDHSVMVQLVNSAKEYTSTNELKPSVEPSKGITEDSRITKEFKRLYDDSMKRNPTAGPSEWDFAATIELLKHHQADDVVAALMIASPDIERRKAGHVVDYAQRTITAAQNRLYAENRPTQSRGEAIKMKVAAAAKDDHSHDDGLSR